MVYLALIVCFLISMAITPYVKKLALKVGATDQPDSRKVHTKIMPRLGGLAIFVSFIIGFIIFSPEGQKIWPVVVGASLITLIGALDDKYQLSAKVKFSGQFVVALITVLGGIQIDFITLPFGFADRIDIGLLSIPITIIWIVGVTNAINLIDGLDGLAAGVSSIALITISGMAIALGDGFVALIGFMLLGSTIGFLLYNFHPAKIFMGDTGALFLGYMISILSIMGLFKNVTLFSLLIPIIILGVPILDTLFAIIRRILHRTPISAPDKLHLHHCLLRLGYSHRQTVLLIYAMSGVFSLAAIIFTRATMWGSTLTLIALMVCIEIIVELTGLVGSKYRPILNLIYGFESRVKK
ncbi:undecaprenyl/decaprenyl-phosphate alpha-N-acetylglucosaminyl 1-phosphate transferase [Aquibacillus halophilus]|uniref:Undecaprenyl/decaprenyl-phosphate alpha-N-acetylglucosaminyl 1-phosphate transferase n=1 Tax=Aquibacillus halophilus TaxID=930132 RepID=A0A6A8D6A1_9BACI|nr:MraY family glycosyltransferase [Aquibacillus halophilus]MRH41305.1 undecaprenyl/decaprenyl-phosphate alpha-N-acetylglucosaminyl 1-phosphate transferase [Aquibacillus halophilus]